MSIHKCAVFCTWVIAWPVGELVRANLLTGTQTYNVMRLHLLSITIHYDMMACQPLLMDWANVKSKTIHTTFISIPYYSANKELGLPVHTNKHDWEAHGWAWAEMTSRMGKLLSKQAVSPLNSSQWCHLYHCPPMCPLIMPPCVDRPLEDNTAKSYAERKASHLAWYNLWYSHGCWLCMTGGLVHTKSLAQHAWIPPWTTLLICLTKAEFTATSEPLTISLKNQL